MRVVDQYKEISTRAIIRAGRIIGSGNALAKKIGVTRQSINYWKSPLGFPPYDKAAAIYVVTNGQVSLDELRPDLKSLNDNLVKMILKKFGSRDVKIK